MGTLLARIVRQGNLRHKAAKCMPVHFYGLRREKSALASGEDEVLPAQRTAMVLLYSGLHYCGALLVLMQIVGQSLNDFRYNPRPSFWPLCLAQFS